MPSRLPFSNITVPVPGFGAMSLSSMYGPAVDSVSHQTLAKAVELGCTFWDTAAIYGLGHNESLIGDFFKDHPEAREKVFVASKCGLAFDPITKARSGITNSPEHIISFLADSTERLGSPPDLYYLHRIDPSTPIETSVATLQKLKEEGKCRYIGLSECGVETLKRACKVAHIDALQIEYSPWCTDYENNGLIETAKELGVAIVAFSPLGSGILSGKYRSAADFGEGDYRKSIPRFSEENFPKNLRIVDEFQRLATKKGCEPSQLALAWVIAQGAIPIPGTRSEDRLEENFGAKDVTLDEEELKELRVLVEEAKPVGDRFTEANMSTLGK